MQKSSCTVSRFHLAKSVESAFSHMAISTFQQAASASFTSAPSVPVLSDLLRAFQRYIGLSEIHVLTLASPHTGCGLRGAGHSHDQQPHGGCQARPCVPRQVRVLQPVPPFGSYWSIQERGRNRCPPKIEWSLCRVNKTLLDAL